MGSGAAALLLFAAVSLTSAQTPVPARPTGELAVSERVLAGEGLSVRSFRPGYVYQTTSTPKVVIEAFYDQ